MTRWRIGPRLTLGRAGTLLPAAVVRLKQQVWTNGESHAGVAGGARLSWQACMLFFPFSVLTRRSFLTTRA